MYKYRRSALIQNYMFSIYELRTKDPSKKSLWLRNKVARLFKNECRIHEKPLLGFFCVLNSHFAQREYYTRGRLSKRKLMCLFIIIIAGLEARLTTYGVAREWLRRLLLFIYFARFLGGFFNRTVKHTYYTQVPVTKNVAI